MMTQQVTVTQALDVGDDVLEVHGTIEGLVDDNGELVEVVARGWVSAMTNHFDSAGYDAKGQRVAGARPREMTKAEKLAYCKSLLAPAVVEVATPTAVDLGIAG